MLENRNSMVDEVRIWLIPFIGSLGILYISGAFWSNINRKHLGITWRHWWPKSLGVPLEPLWDLGFDMILVVIWNPWGVFIIWSQIYQDAFRDPGNGSMEVWYAMVCIYLYILYGFVWIYIYISVISTICVAPSKNTSSYPHFWGSWSKQKDA